MKWRDTPPVLLPSQLSAWHRTPEERSASNQVKISLPLYFTHRPSIFLVHSLQFNSPRTLSVFVVSKCLTLLIEIHPINNTKVLKAVDCRVKVQVEFYVSCLGRFHAGFTAATSWCCSYGASRCTSVIDYIFYKLAESELACSCCIFYFFLS